MKKIIILLCFVLLFEGCNSSKNIVNNTTSKQIVSIQKPLRKKATTANATKNNRGYLIGVADRAMFNDTAYKYWFDDRYNSYNTNKEIIAKLKPIINNFTIRGFMGTWCGDSKRETPRFYKILEETEFNLDYFELITVGRNKKTPDNLQEGFQIIRVPTFIFYKNGKEVGRFVEYPRESLEKDLLKILTGQPYKHSYDRSN